MVEDHFEIYKAYNEISEFIPEFFQIPTMHVNPFEVIDKPC